MIFKRSALVLIGGKCSRAKNFPKYLLRYNDETFLARQVSILKKVCDEIIISCRDEIQCQQIEDIQVDIKVTDVKKEAGPVEGIRTGVSAARGVYIFIVACDMPFISPRIISYLFDLAESADAAVPRWSNGNLEPLYAVYRKETLLRYFENHSPRRLIEIAEKINTIIVPIEELRSFDPELLSFTNINDLRSYYELTGLSVKSEAENEE